MARPLSDEPVIRHGKVAFNGYVDYDFAMILREYFKKNGITTSDVLTKLACKISGIIPEHELALKMMGKVVDGIVTEIESESNKEQKQRIESAYEKVAVKKAEEERKAVEQKAEEDKAAEEQKKYMEKVWRSLRREIIFNYDLINLQLKEIAAKKSRGDEEDYEADQYQEIRAYLENKKILHSQKDLSYDLFIECFNSIDFAEEVEKPRLLAEKEMADGVEA